MTSFKVGTYGGTIISSALNKQMEIVDKEFHPNAWNIYTFYCGDGENWASDNEKCIDLFKEIKEISQLTAYCEINENYEGNLDEESLKKMINALGLPLGQAFPPGKTKKWTICGQN
jgi:uncharacterized sporulation protein YeaH/YhbH (DUF444 family)